jgi:hypothetical protein
LSEKRESFTVFFMTRGEGTLSDSGLYIGEVYEEEFGLTAAGVGSCGRSTLELLRESSGRLRIPACAARKSPYTALLGAI